MNDTPAQSGYERDLQIAELALLASGNDPAAYATALRDYFAAHRNYTQGAMVPMFVQMVERILDDKLTPVVLGIGGLQLGQNLLNNGFQSLSEIVNQLVLDMQDSKEDRQSINSKVDKLQIAFDRLQAEFIAYRANNRRSELDILKTQVAALYKATHHDNEITE